MTEYQKSISFYSGHPIGVRSLLFTMNIIGGKKFMRREFSQNELFPMYLLDFELFYVYSHLILCT